LVEAVSALLETVNRPLSATAKTTTKTRPVVANTARTRTGGVEEYKREFKAWKDREERLLEEHKEDLHTMLSRERDHVNRQQLGAVIGDVRRRQERLEHEAFLKEQAALREGRPTAV